MNLSHTRRLAGVSGSLLAAAAVLLGAFGAHALRSVLDPDALALWRTAVDYQFLHAFGLLFIALPSRPAAAAERLASMAFLCGILFFCGSLYCLALGAPRWTGILTPIGGASFIVGWVAMAHALWPNVNKR